MKKRMFLIFLLSVFCIVFSQTSDLKISIRNAGKGFDLKLGWWNEIIHIDSDFFERSYKLPTGDTYEIMILRNDDIWVSQSFFLAEKTHELEIDVLRRTVDVTLIPYKDDKFSHLDIVKDGKIISECFAENGKYRALFSWEYNKDIEFEIAGDSGFMYGPVHIKAEQNLNRFELEFKLPEKKEILKTPIPDKNIPFTLSIDGDMPDNLIITRENLSNGKIIEKRKLESNISAYHSGINNIFRIFSGKHELFNFIPEKENINLLVINSENINVKGDYTDLSFRTSGIWENIRIDGNIIPGPVFCSKDENILEIFEKDTKIHYQNLTPELESGSVIVPGKARIILDYIIESGSVSYIYMNWDENGEYSPAERIYKALKKENGHFSEIFHIKPLSVEDKREYYFRIGNESGRISRRFPLFVKDMDDIYWFNDFERFRDNPVYTIKFLLKILPLNRWDRFFLKHDFLFSNQEMQGLVKEELKQTHSSGVYMAEFNSYQGEKRFELWAYDNETSDYEMIYADDFYLSESKTIEYNYDRSEKLDANEKIFSVLYGLIAILVISYSVYFLSEKYNMHIIRKADSILLNQLFTEKLNIICADKDFISYYIEFSGKNVICSENITYDAGIILEKNIFAEELFFSVERIDFSIYEELNEFCEKENIKLNVFAHTVEKKVNCVRIIKENRYCQIFTSENKNLEWIKDYDKFNIVLKK